MKPTYQYHVSYTFTANDGSAACGSLTVEQDRKMTPKDLQKARDTLINMGMENCIIMFFTEFPGDDK